MHVIAKSNRLQRDFKLNKNNIVIVTFKINQNKIVIVLTDLSSLVARKVEYVWAMHYYRTVGGGGGGG